MTRERFTDGIVNRTWRDMLRRESEAAAREELRKRESEAAARQEESQREHEREAREADGANSRAREMDALEAKILATAKDLDERGADIWSKPGFRERVSETICEMRAGDLGAADRFVAAMAEWDPAGEQVRAERHAARMRSELTEEMRWHVFIRDGHGRHANAQI